jgi:hypothetical protein
VFAIARGAAPGAWRRPRTRVLFAALCVRSLMGCRTYDDHRHRWHDGHHGHHGYHRHHGAPSAPHAYQPIRPLTPPVFAVPRAKLPELPPRHHWHRARSGDHTARHRHDRGREHHRRAR